MDKDDLTVREAEAWAELRTEVDRLSPLERAALILDDDGWTTQDVLWHVAHWWDHLAGLLDDVREGTFEEPPEDEAATDAANAMMLAESRAMDLAEVEAGVERARGRMLAAWSSLAEPTAAAERWFVWETTEHYEEHLPQLRRATASAG
jgi:hypothetical protein